MDHEQPDRTASAGEPSDGQSASASDLEKAVIAALKTCYDPEIPVDIYELGLIYSVKVGAEGHVDIQMTLTSPACPVAGSLPGDVETRVRSVPGVEGVQVELVWDPTWDREMMSEVAKLKLGMF